MAAASATPPDALAGEILLTAPEVATLFRVDPKTVGRWVAAGRISSVRTPGGQLRFREAEIRRLLDGVPAGTAAPGGVS